jgi:hypothetical protein
VTPLLLAGVWVVGGLAAALLGPLRRRRRLAWTVPAIAGLCALAVSTTAPWPGPAASARYGASFALGRPGAGLLVAAGIALALTLALAPRLDGGEVLTACAAGAACAVALAATVAIVWSVAIAIAVATISVRWITTAPHRATLAAGRIAGLGAAALIAAAAFLPGAGPTLDARTALAGGCLAAGVSALLALIPLGGWAAASTGLVRGADVAPWALLVAPTVLLGSLALMPGLPPGARNPFANVLLVMGLVSALWGGLMALRSTEPARYGRVLIADLALAAAGLGSTHASGRLGCFVLVLTHLGAAPLLLHTARSALDRQRRLAWLSLSGLPPTPAFWGRYLVLLSLAAASGTALLAGLAASAALMGTAARALAGGWRPGDALPAPRVTRVLAWSVALGLLGLGFAPAWLTTGVFGSAVSG